MNRKTLTAAALVLLALTFCTWCTLRGAAQGRDASMPAQGPSATPRPARTPRHHRVNESPRRVQRPARSFVTVTIISNLPYCNVLIDGEPEEKGTDEQSRLSIPMEPGVYDVGVASTGYVTEVREVEVKSPPPYQQEERFVLRRALLSLQVKTNPAGVKVNLDGKMEAESDSDGLLIFKEVDPSVQHTLHATKEDYREETVTVPPYKREASVRLARDVLTLKVKTYPPQAEVFLDDEPKGVSDAEGVLLIPKVKTDKEHVLRASKEGFVTQTATVLVNYELAVIKLPSMGETPTPSVGRTSPGGANGQGAPGGHQEAREGDGSAPQTSVMPQGVAAPPGDDAPRATHKEEGSPPPSQKSEQYGLPLDVEITFWNTIKDSKNPEEFAAYLRKYPQGQFVELARIRMNAILANRTGEDGTTAAGPGPEPSRPTPTPTPTPSPTPTPVSTQTPALTFAAGPGPEPASAVPAVAPDRPLEETVDWLKRHFASKFTYTYTEPRQHAGGAPPSQNAHIQVEPLRFEGCRIEWRVFDDIHRVSLSDLDPADIKVALRTAPGTTYSINVWTVTLVGADGREAFEKLEGGRGASPKKYWRLVLLYDDKEKADGVAAAFGRAIILCSNRAQR
jgi:hypothetical protein